MLALTMEKRYPVVLAESERMRLKRLIAAGAAPAGGLTHARILLEADESPEGPGRGAGPGRADERVAEAKVVGLGIAPEVPYQAVGRILERTGSRRAWGGSGASRRGYESRQDTVGEIVQLVARAAK